MDSTPEQPAPDSPGDKPGHGDEHLISQGVRHAQISARVPERVATGVFSTGAIVLQGPHEFVIDFIVSLRRPHQIAARVIMPISVMSQIIAALKENLARYEQQFGPIRRMPTAAPGGVTNIQELYDELKLPDERLSGTYANAMIVSHSHSEFCFDFLTNFYPRAAVSARVYLATPQVPRLLETVDRAFQQFIRRQQQNQAGQNPNASEPPSRGGPPDTLGPEAPKPDQPQDPLI